MCTTLSVLRDTKCMKITALSVSFSRFEFIVQFIFDCRSSEIVLSRFVSFVSTESSKRIGYWTGFSWTTSHLGEVAEVN